MQKKKYQKPTMEIVKLQQQPQLLAGSGGQGGTNPYVPDNDPYNW